MEFQKHSSDQFEAIYIYVCLCCPDDVKPVQIMGVYASPTLQWDVLNESTAATQYIIGNISTKVLSDVHVTICNE